MHIVPTRRTEKTKRTELFRGLLKEPLTSSESPIGFSMTIDDTLCSYTILQKSITVCGIGIWVSMNWFLFLNPCQKNVKKDEFHFPTSSTKIFMGAHKEHQGQLWNSVSGKTHVEENGVYVVVGSLDSNHEVRSVSICRKDVLTSILVQVFSHVTSCIVIVFDFGWHHV